MPNQDTDVLERVLIAPRKLRRAALLAAQAALDGTSDPLLLSQAQVGRLLSCSRFTVRRMVQQGTLHPISIRGLLRYKMAEIRALTEGGDA